MDISQRFAELRDSGAEVDEAVRQIFREDYNADIKTLVTVTGFDGAHIGRLKGQVSRALGRKAAPPGGRVEDREMVPPLTLEFKAAIDDLLERSSERFREHLAILFERQADKLIKNRDAFENFLLRNGLTPVQANGVMERIMVIAGQQPPGQDFQMVPIPGGGGFYILQSGQPQTGQPIILQSPGGAPGKTAEEARAEARLESRMERLEEKIGTFIEGGGKGGAREPLMRRGRRPLFDDDGNILKDASGEIIFEEFEEPWEPGAKDTITETLLPLMVKQMIGKAPKEIDEEALVLKIKEKLTPAGEGGKISTETIREAIRSEMSDVRKDLETLKKDQERRERGEEIDRAVVTATKEYKTIIDGLTAQLGERGGYKGLSDAQATMRYQKELVDTMVDAVSNQVASVREDIRPFILQQAVQSMKMQGMSDEIIGQFLNAVRQRIPATGAISESSKEAAVERVKQWSKT